ncbi:Coagulation factor 5/8 C-terminal domain, partial [Trinorchestia longiramus]
YEETDYTASDDVYVICSREVGLTCSNLQQAARGRCHDYSIRVYCSCDPVPPVVVSPTIPPLLTTQSTPYPGWPVIGPDCEDGKERVECAAPCDRVCMYFRDLLQDAEICQRDDDCAPACADPLQRSACPPGLYLQDNSTCVTSDMCTCKLPSGQPLPAGSEFKVSECETCKCAFNKLECVTSSKCVTKEVTVEPLVGVTTLAPLEVTKPILTSTSTLPVTRQPIPPVQIRCNEWTPWLNMKRNNLGDFQRIADLRQRDEFSALCETPLNVSCREANAKLPAAQLGQVLTCDPSEGLVCLNANNSQPCYDYEVAFFCACEEDITVTSSPADQEYNKSNNNNNIIKTVTGIVTTPAPCNAWSPWINEQKPWISNGDSERKTLAQLRQEFGFCLEGELADIECHNTANGLSTPDRDTICDLRFGFQCKNEKQPKGACYDHRIRYYCSCDTTPATTTVVMVPIVPTLPSVCNPDDYVELLQEVQDEAFAASSSINSYFGPPQARLSDPAVMGWSPRTDIPNQYLQVTLPGPRTLYGVMVAGSPNSPNAVEVFTLKVSDDGTVWSTVLENPDDPLSPVVYFRGPSRGTNLPVTRLLPRPVETRLVRITPITWNVRPVMRVEL